MRLGLIARSDNSGLGMQTYEFYRHMKPAKTMVVDISKFNSNRVYPERYPGAQFVKGFPMDRDIDEFLKDLDVVFIAEAPYNYRLYSRARELGVKTAVQYNYEFFDWFSNPDWPKPDMLIAPSRWNFDLVQGWCNDNNVEHVYLHCPVNRDVLPQRSISQAKVFLHTAGKTAAFDRNGTKTVIEASMFIKSDAMILIHFQGEQGLAHQATHSVDDYRNWLQSHGVPSRVNIVQEDYDNYTDVYAQGDALLLPRRYGGNCLPLNEALSIGMPAIMTNISPNDSFLPPDWLIPAEKVGEFEPRTKVEIYGSKAQDLAAKIDWLAGLDETEMLEQSKRASRIARSISWEVMKPHYERILEGLCTR